MEILKKDITIDKIIGKQTSQILIEGDIIVPDFKPDIDIVLEANGTAYIDNKEISNERISFKGNLGINILFISKSEDKSIHNMQNTYPINDFITMDGVEKNMTVFTKVNITNLDYKPINDRKVSFRAVLEVCTEVLSKENFEIISTIDGLNKDQIKINNITMNKIICSKFDRFNIKDELGIATDSPNIKEILDVNFNIANKDVKILLDKIVISGDIKICILYKGNEDEAITTYFEQMIPFNGSIEVDGAMDSMIGDVHLDVQNNSIQVLENNDGENRLISVDAYIGCNIQVSHEETIEVLEDAYSLDKVITLDKNEQTYPVLICKNKNQTSIKETVRLNDNCPPILQILKVTGKPILDNIQVLDNKIIAEGIVECKILYITSIDEYPIYCFNSVIPYNQVIESKDTNPERTDVDIHITLENIAINMLSDKDLEIRCSINFDTCITANNSLCFINDISFSDIDFSLLESIASITMYIVQEGDTLWALAKKFNTTICDIVEVNDLENPNSIYIGQKLLILKKIH